MRENAGKLAIQRGPVVYCLEEVDNGSNLPDLSISKDAQLTAEFDEGLFGGSVVIRGTAQRSSDNNWEDKSVLPSESLAKLGLEYLDLYLIHWPVKGKYKDSWRVLEKLYEEGLFNRCQQFSNSSSGRYHVKRQNNPCSKSDLILSISKNNKKGM